ncbi:MAG: hypothetical protein BWX88_01022 [Planctomycetes bacterium ADurb.Bin126]|nr:MAG: hypothetical protein BWX88_01022 [Planctomycetes bacterium ADurb.Bin126]HOD83909.1 DUF1553 domain-containing protein [Phycisphaerae bacterium]HQL74907.1 DUF1553 domain-containing protein [Phycisphaerae bacterium]
MATSAFSMLVLVGVLAGQAPPAGAGAFESTIDLTPQCKIDELVFGRLKELNIQPSGVCSDGVFFRRVYLDVVGTLPTAKEAAAFLNDKDPAKRAKLIDRLLERIEYADYWALRWCDALRVKGEFPINLWPNGAQAYHRWIRTCLADNVPYDQFVREMLTASGSNFRRAPVNFYRANQDREPANLARLVALTFMGQRADKWPKDKLDGMAVFFSQVGYKSTLEWKEEIVFHDLSKAAQATTRPALAQAAFPDGTKIALPDGKDPREVFADWLLSAQNPCASRAIVNRVWFWLQGRGIVHECDDIRDDNPPANPALLDYLARELVSAKWDVKHVCRLILNSKTYQLSSIPRVRSERALANFAYYPVRRLEAEVLIDALCQITGTGERYMSETPEPFSYIPDSQRTIYLADGSVTSPFLEMFGRPPRDTGLESERSNRPTPSQRLHVLNSSHILNKLKAEKFQSLIYANKSDRDVIRDIYLTFLSRLPTDDEIKTVETYSRSKVVQGRQGLLDLAWALMNTDEFLYRH